MTVRLIPDVSAVALRSHQEREASLWYCLRSLNTTGSGFVDKSYAIEHLQATFGYSAPQVYSLLKRGEGKFYSCTGQQGRTIKIHGLLSVCKYLGIVRLSSCHSRSVSSTEFDTAALRRAQLYASFHKPGGVHGNPISRLSIQETTGLAPVQQRRLEKRAHVKRTPNYAMDYQQQALGDSYQPQKIMVQGKSRTYQVNKRLGNTFHTQQQDAGQGMLRKINRELAGRQRSSVSEGAPGRSIAKRFYQTYKKLSQAIARNGEQCAQDTLYRVHRRLRSISGRQEWARVVSYA